MSKVKNNNGYHGVTEPISLSGPTEKYLMQTAEVEKYLSDARLYERQDEAILREEVLGKLDQTVKAWIKKATRINGYGEQFVHEANAKTFTFGSYCLGVHGPDADIDTLCVGPRHATRNEYFFRWLHDILAEMPEVSELHPVPDAHVPVLGFKINGVSIDLLYANLAHAVIPESREIMIHYKHRKDGDYDSRSYIGPTVKESQILKDKYKLRTIFGLQATTTLPNPILNPRTALVAMGKKGIANPHAKKLAK
ncbi:Nuclear poly(A) polymerase 1 [Zea mays]|uniref:polynucleotide adenylyltransferase n=1 Tax=Zea mays TaxID=4577 RepID=A0A3L6EU26_MAIZE|nr:Nuclear poly(A) polymerase 1 [Zea mays]